jgi:hypothetical protein
LIAAQAAARAFVELLDVRAHRAALVSFSSLARLDVPLTTDAGRVIDGVRTLEADGETNLAAALDLATDHLGVAGRPDGLGVIVMLTDGRHNAGDGNPSAAGARARARGIDVYTIGLGDEIDGPLLRDIAGWPDRHFLAPTPDRLYPIYVAIRRAVAAGFAGNLTIEEPLDRRTAYESGSALPAALEHPDRLLWGRTLLPAGDFHLRYVLRAEAAALIAVGAGASASYTDADGVRRRVEFPPALLAVAAPTGTPGPTPRAVPTDTLTAASRLYLPALATNR